MDRLKAGYEKLRRHTEQVGDKMMRQAFHGDGGHLMKEKLAPKRQFNIRGRTVIEDRQISEGGFAFVWRVRDSHSGEEFALKKIVCQDKEGLAMASREVSLLERLPAHPNIVRYYGHCIVDTQGYAKEVCLLFELCSGGHLLDLLDRNQGKLGEPRILSVFRDIITAVAVLHAQVPPIQHRDLKVENVLLGMDGKFKLCDFGSWSSQCSDLARLDRQAISALQEQIERYTTMMYRPPEMVDFFQPFTISEKVDIWMLGCILFTLMYCRHPFQDESSLAIANARYYLSSEPAYSQKLQDLVHWLLARDPANRPSAAQLLEALQHFADSGPLPLPSEVLERRDKDRRLYEEKGPPAARSRSNKPSSAGSTAELGAEARAEKQRHHKSKKDREPRRAEDAGAADAFWQAAPPASADPWPCAAAPVPPPAPGAWATFNESGWPQATEPPQPSAPGAVNAPTSPTRAPAGAALWDTPWPDAPVPSASSRAPPPPLAALHGAAAAPGGLPTSPSARRPLEHSGHSNHSGGSLRSGASIGRSPRSARRTFTSSTAGLGEAPDSPKARGWESERRGSGQDAAAAGDFWSLAQPAAPADEVWGRAVTAPLAATAQWPSPALGPTPWPDFPASDASAPPAEPGRQCSPPVPLIAGGTHPGAALGHQSLFCAGSEAAAAGPPAGEALLAREPLKAGGGGPDIWAVLDGRAAPPMPDRPSSARAAAASTPLLALPPAAGDAAPASDRGTPARRSYSERAPVANGGDEGGALRAAHWPGSASPAMPDWLGFSPPRKGRGGPAEQESESFLAPSNAQPSRLLKFNAS